MNSNYYKIRKNSTIYEAKNTIYESEDKIEIYSRNLPSSNPITGIKIHLLDETDIDQVSAANLIVSDPSKYLYIVDLKKELIGSHFLYGLCADYVQDFERFLADVKIGKINLVFINIDFNQYPNNLSVLLEDLIRLSGKNEVANIHILVCSIGILKEVSGRMDEFFLKHNGNILDND